MIADLVVAAPRAYHVHWSSNGKLRPARHIVLFNLDASICCIGYSRKNCYQLNISLQSFLFAVFSLWIITNAALLTQGNELSNLLNTEITPWFSLVIIVHYYNLCSINFGLFSCVVGVLVPDAGAAALCVALISPNATKASVEEERSCCSMRALELWANQANCTAFCAARTSCCSFQY